ncbi:succinate dehydrogenase assembly factor 2 [Tolumonas lignilytica]|uniref:FAD assembly factor SdhE n=1 Tax=Tolumonas lignilytica TaxID=1283284 RepID=UPI003B83A256
MLELDTILAPFLEHEYPELSDVLQRDFQRVLNCSDLELYRCLLRAETPSDLSLQSILGVIREKHQARHSS